MEGREIQYYVFYYDPANTNQISNLIQNHELIYHTYKAYEKMNIGRNKLKKNNIHSLNKMEQTTLQKYPIVEDHRPPVRDSINLTLVHRHLYLFLATPTLHIRKAIKVS